MIELRAEIGVALASTVGALVLLGLGAQQARRGGASGPTAGWAGGRLAVPPVVGALVGSAAGLLGVAASLAGLEDVALAKGLTQPLPAALGWTALLALALACVRPSAARSRWWLLGPGVAWTVPWLSRAAELGPSGPLPGWIAAAAAVATGILLSTRGRPGKLAEASLQALEAAGDGIVVVDGRGRVIEARGEVADALVAGSEGARSPRRLPGAVGVQLFEAPIHTRVKVGTGRILEIWTGTTREPRDPNQLFGILVRDVTKQHRDKRHLVQLAHYDSLTGLANRRLFLDRLKQCLVVAAGQGDTAALLYIDLDHFKEVNDSLGHGAGDALLKSVAQRLLENLEPAKLGGRTPGANPQVTLARLSGDEFAIVVSRVASPGAVRELGTRVVGLLKAPFQIGERAVSISASVGIALFPRDADNLESLIHSADSAVYAAKKGGRDGVSLYEPAMDSGRERFSRVAQALRHAIEDDELSLHYQPKVDPTSETVVGLEALMRWKSAELGDVSPGEFIPVAEARGIITELGSWCIDEACRQIRLWRDNGMVVVPVAVNVSSAQLLDNDLQRVLTDALKTHGVKPELLEIELTESLLLDGGEDTARCLRDLRTIGVRIALDDFGTGYSALTYLNTFPLDILKMDRGFIRDIHLDDSAAGIAAAVVAMAHRLGLSVVAEGVDALEQLSVLREMSCDEIQGFLYSPALPAEEATGFLARRGEPAPVLLTVTTHPGMLPVAPNQPQDRESPPVAEPVAPCLTAAEGASLLLVDDDEGSFKPVVERLVRLVGTGADLHYASTPDEALRLIEKEGLVVHALATPPSVDLEKAGRIREKLAQKLGRDLPLIVLGEEPNASVRSQLRAHGVTSVLWLPFSDTEFAFVLRSALLATRKRSRRSALRVPVELEARMQAGPRREVVLVSSLSTRGAFLEMSDPLPIETRLRLEFKLVGETLQLFGRVVNEEHGDGGLLARNGVGVRFYGGDRNAELRVCKAVEELATRYLP